MNVRVPSSVALALAISVVLAVPAGADPATDGTAAGYGGRLDISDSNVGTEPEVSSTLAEEDASATTINIPGDPLAVSGTLTASAAVHRDSDLTSHLLQESQALEGPYNAVGFGEIEAARVLLNAAGEGADLLRADVIRAEAVATCTGTTVTYSAQSEIINLEIGGEDVPLNAPVSQLIDAVNGVLTDSGLDQVVNIERNVVTQDGSGASVDALRVTVLAAAGEAPLGTVVLGHAEVSGVQCGDDPAGGQQPPPECSDDVDNADPEDELADEDDPGCHTDMNPNNPDSYDPDDDDETDVSMPRTGSGAVPVAVALLGFAGMLALASRPGRLGA